ncbi:MAG TPA: adenylate/guanylate cyclase domain-containing protein [Longimicrobiales bacterium]|nr:adenylate/guanylate cyclase domain-containing protein [Longimicrobiales bacterium]
MSVAPALVADSGNRAAGGGRPASAQDVWATMESLSSAVAVADPESLTLEYTNARFRDWFAGDSPDLALRVPGFDAPKVRDRLARGRSSRWETAVSAGGRSVAVQVEIRAQSIAGSDRALIEAQSIAKQKEAEYMLDSYSRLVERKTRELEQEKERAERLLLNIMPRRVYEELREFGTTTPQAFDEVSVLLLDFAGFTEMAIAREPTALIAELNDVFTSFDRIVEHHRCERIKTIGDAYMAVAGVPDADPEHAIHMARVALRIRRFLERRNANSPTKWHPRIGIGCGPAIGSIVGVQKYVYDIFGPAVNLASRLENLADPMQILVCPTTADRIRDEFIVADAGVADLRGFGDVRLFDLVEEARKGR